MKLPIIGYGHALLRRVAEPVTADYPELEKLIEDRNHVCSQGG